ncbi:MAG: murein biosynthesis integral membrane protein MurJ [Planctomycetota bacterium]
MPEPPAASGHIAGRALRLLLGTLGSRALGFVRILLMARFFGGGGATDVFFVAYLVPNLFRRALGEQAVESAFLPVFKALVARGERRAAWRAARVTLKWFVLALLAAAVFCFAFAPQLVGWVLAPGFDRAAASDAAALGRLMSPFIIIIGLAAFCGALLLAHDRALAYSASPILFNAGWIGAMVVLHGRLGTYSLAVGVLAGGVLYLAATVVAIAVGRRRGRIPIPPVRAAGWSNRYASEAFRAAGPVCLAALIARCATAVDCAVASTLPTGAVSALRYAMPLVLLPFALFGLSVGRAALVPLSEHAGRGDVGRFEDAAGHTMHLGFLVLVPLSLGTILLAEPLAGVFRAGKFEADEARMLAVAVRYYALGLVGMGFVGIFARAMYALKDTRTPLKVAAVALVANAALSIGLARTPLRHGGIALATAIAMSLQAALLFLAMRRALRRGGAGGAFGRVWRPVARVIAGTVVMAGPTVGALAGLNALTESPHLLVRLLRVAVPALVGAGTYGLVMWLLDRRGLRSLLRA